MSLWLQGRSRMSLDKLRTQVRILTKFEDVSEFILIHIGDIAKIDLKEPRKYFKYMYIFVHKILLPENDTYMLHSKFQK
jgi:hypothetical protein